MLKQSSEFSETKAGLLYTAYSLALVIELIVAYYALTFGVNTFISGAEHAGAFALFYLIIFGGVVWHSCFMMKRAVQYMGLTVSSVLMCVYGFLFYLLGLLPLEYQIDEVRVCCFVAMISHVVVLLIMLVKQYYPLNEDKEDETRHNPHFHVISKLLHFSVYLWGLVLVGMLYFFFTEIYIPYLQGVDPMEMGNTWEGKLYALLALGLTVYMIHRASYRWLLRQIYGYIAAVLLCVMYCFLTYQRIEGEYLFRALGDGQYQLQVEQNMKLRDSLLQHERIELKDGEEAPHVTWKLRWRFGGYGKAVDSRHYLQPEQGEWQKHSYVHFISWQQEEEGDDWEAKVSLSVAPFLNNAVHLAYLAYLLLIYAFIIRELRERKLKAIEAESE